MTESKTVIRAKALGEALLVNPDDYWAKLKADEILDWNSLTEEQRKQDENLLSKAYDLDYVWLGKIHDLEEQAISKRIKRLIHEWAVHQYHLEEASAGLL